MKVIKPERLGILQRVVQQRRRCQLVVTVFSYVPFDAPRHLLSEIAMWRELGPLLSQGVLDEGHPKPKAEVLVTGSAYAPAAATCSEVAVRLGLTRDGQALIDKALIVSGDRFWKDSKASDALAFSELPLEHAHAFGGPDYAPNPAGKGACEIEAHGHAFQPLPNIESPDERVKAPEDRPAPAGFGAYPLDWPQRFQHIGSDYGPQWLKEHSPGPAVDFNPAFYNTAPADQQLEAYFDGSEAFIIEGMHPEQPRVAGSLAPLRVRAFITRADADLPTPGPHAPPPEKLEAVDAHLDTIHLFPGLQRALLIYRACLEVEDDDAADVAHLMIAAEDPTRERPLSHYQEVLARRLDKDKGALAGMLDEDLMPPESKGWTARPQHGDAATMPRLELRAQEKNKRGLRRSMDQAKAEMLAAGLDPGEHFDERPCPEVPDPDDIAGIIALVEEMQAQGQELEDDMKSRLDDVDDEKRADLEKAGLDPDGDLTSAPEGAGGPPTFSADEQLGQLHDLARIAHQAGEPLEDLERDLTDPAYEQMLRDLEARGLDGYRASAHLAPAASMPNEEQRAILRHRVATAHDIGEPMAHIDLCGADLSGMDLRDIDLAGAFLEGADLSDADLRGAKLTGAVLVRANLKDTRLNDADLSEANIGGTQLCGTDLSGARLHGTIFMRSRLEGVSLHEASLKETQFFETTFADVDMSYASMPHTLFLETDLRETRFIGAQLEHARFLEVDLRGVDFTGAVLERASMFQCQGDGACFAGANLLGAVIAHHANFENCVFAGADLSEANFRKVPLAGGDFEHAVLTDADLTGCDLRGANLHQVKARGASLVRTDFRDGSLRGADLLGAMMQKAKLEGCDLEGANISRADLSLASGDDRTRLDETLRIDTRFDPRRGINGLPGGAS